MPRNYVVRCIGAWEEYLALYISQVTTALRTGGRPPPPPPLNVEQTIGAELAHYRHKGLANWVELAAANLDTRAERNERAGHFLNHAERWREAANLIRNYC